MNKSKLYDDLAEIISSYQSHNQVDTDENSLDASDLYRMLTQIYANWNSLSAE